MVEMPWNGIATGVVASLLLFLSVYVAKRRRRLRRAQNRWEDRWSIGIYIGDSPLQLSAIGPVRNPVLTARDVSDVKADFVADPFMVRNGGVWYMFFEVFDAHTHKGKIGHAASEDGLRWVYKGTVLEAPWHLSYPYAFRWEEDFYIVPESQTAEAIHLYKAIHFPEKWTLARVLLNGVYCDPSIFQHNDTWWVLAGSRPASEQRNQSLHLFFADDLFSDWREHPKSPVITANPRISRPAGRILAFAGRLVRFAQDGEKLYGSQIRAFEITKLSRTDYEEKEVKLCPPLMASGKGWNADGMHHVDLQQISNGKWIACVDGNQRQLVF